jgi:hypothetical protein
MAKATFCSEVRIHVLWRVWWCSGEHWDDMFLLTHGMQGIEPRVLWIGIGGSIFFGVLEKTKSMLAERRNRELRAVKDE